MAATKSYNSHWPCNNPLCTRKAQLGGHYCCLSCADGHDEDTTAKKHSDFCERRQR